VTVEQVRTQSVPRSRALAPGRTPTTTVSSSRPTSEDGPLCLVVPEIADGEGTALVRSLRRRDSTRAVLLTRSAGRRDLVVLLGGGIRGAVTSEPVGGPRGGRPSGPPPGTPALTAREVGVLRLVADGRTNREIGEALSLSALTVKSHLARISRKVGTGDRAEMVAFAIRHELLR
jgi:DNA-binding CsgD family transcriptional regulator